jgi:hypothetical protein
MSTNDFSDRSTGWVTRDGQRCFLTGSGALGAGGLDPTARADLGQGNVRHYALPDPPPDLYPAVTASLGYLDLADRFQGVVLLWAAMYAAPLCPLKTLDAVIWVHGPTGCGKSVVTHLALAHFGPNFVCGRSFRPVVDWTATLASLENAMYRAKDVPLVIDDCAAEEAGDGGAVKGAGYTVSGVVRQVSRRSARERATPSGERFSLPPRGLVVATAEYPPVGRGVARRTIRVPVEYGQVTRIGGDNAALDQAQAHAESGLYAQAMAGYVVWLAKNWSRLAEEVPQRIEQERQAGLDIFGYGRLADHYALLVVADRLALEYAAAVNALPLPGMATARARQHQQAIVEVLERGTEES